MAKERKKKDGLLQKLRGAKQQKSDPELQSLLQEMQADPNNMRIRLKVADYYLKQGESVRALDQYLTVAETYAEKGFYPKAIAVYKQALQIKPSMIEVYLKLASLYHKLGLMPEVVEQYQKAAAIYEEQGKEREALDIRRMMLDLDPTNVIGRLKLGQRYLEKGFTAEAVAEFLRAANIFEQQGKHAELQKLLEGILDRGVENFDILYRLVEIYRHQGKPALALARLAKLSGELAGSSSTLELTAELAEELGKPAVAVKALERAGALYQQINRLDKVREVCHHILRLAPGDEYAQQKLNEIGPEPEPEPVAPVEEEPVIEAVAEPAAEPALDELEIEIEEAAPTEAAIEELPIEEEIPIETAGEEEVAIEEVQLEEEIPVAAAPAAEEEIVIEELPIEEEEPVRETKLEPEVEEISLEEETPVADDIAAEVNRRMEELPIEEIAIEELPEEPALDEDIVVEEEAVTFEVEEPAAEVAAPEEAAAEPEEEGPEQIDLSGMSEDEATSRIEEAIDIYLKYNLRDKAIEYLNLALARNPESLPILEKVMAVHRDGGNNEKATEILERLIELARAQDRAAKLEQYLTLMVEYAPDNLDAARQLADYFVDREPERAVIHLFELAGRYRDLEQFDEAEKVFARILELDPENEGAHQELLGLYEQTEQIDRAVEKLYFLYDRAMTADDTASAEGYLRRILELRPLEDKAQESLLELYDLTDQNDKQADLLRRLADRFAAAGKGDQAIAYFLRLLDLEPENAAAHHHLKDLYLEAGDTEKAIAELQIIARQAADGGLHAKAIEAWQEILALEPAGLETHEELCALYLVTGDREQAISEMMLLAKASLDREDLPAALAQLDRVLDLEPRYEQAKRRKISILHDLDRTAEAIDILFDIADDMRRAGEMDKAENALREVLTFDPEARQAHVALKDLYLDAGQSQKAVAELGALAAAAEAADRLDESLTYWGEIAGLDPENLESRQGIARVYVARGDVGKAVAELLAVAELQERRGDRTGAIDTLNQALASDPENEVAALRLIELYFETKQPERAVQSLLLVGDQAREANRFMKALEYYRRIVEVNAAHVVAHERLRDLYLELNRPEFAIDELTALAGLYRQAEEVGRVEEAYRQILQLSPDHLPAVLALKDYYLDLGRLEPALDLLYGLVVRFRQAGDLAESAKYAEEMLSLAAEDRRALLALAEMAVQAGDTDAAVVRYLYLATLSQDENRGDLAENYLRKVIGLNPDHREARSDLKALLLAGGEKSGAVQQLFALVEIATRQGDTEDAKAFCREVLAIDSRNEQALEQLVDLLVAGGEGAAAIDEMFQLAEMAQGKNDYPRAEKYLRQILDLESENGRALELLSQVHISSGDTGQAIRELFQLAEAAEKKDDYAAALSSIQQILELDGENLSALSSRAVLEEMLEQPEAAVITLEQLAGVQVARELLSDALRSLRQAQKLAPFSETIHDRLVDLLARTGETQPLIEELLRFHAAAIAAGDHEVVLSVAQRILELDPSHETAHRMLVDAYKAAGDSQQAVGELFALVDLAMAGQRVGEAETLLREILALDQTNELAVDEITRLYLDSNRSEEAIRTLLSFGDAQGDAGNVEVARDSYERVLELRDGHPDALRKLKDSYLFTADLAEAVEVLFRMVVAADQREEPQKAIAALVEILDLDEINEEARRDLKERYLAAGQAEQAIALLFVADQKMTAWDGPRRLANLAEIVEIDPTNRQALRRTADLYKESRQPERAEEVLLRLADLAIDAAEWEPAQKTLQEALSLNPASLAVHQRIADIHQRRGDNEAYAAELFAIGKLLQTAGQEGEAERILRQAAGLEKYREKALDELLSLYAAFGRSEPRRAVQLEQAQLAAERGDLNRAIGYYNDILAANAEDRETRDALIDLFAAHERTGDAATQAMILADAARKDGEVDEAIRRYGQVLSFDAQNAKARRRLKNLYIEANRPAEAVEQLRFLAEAAKAAGGTDDVEDALNEMLQLQPEDGALRRELITLYEASGQPGKAIIQLLELADQGIAEGRTAEAIDILREAAGLQADNEPVQRRLKDAYLEVGQRDRAIETLFTLYSIELAAKKRRAAEKHLREILELDPTNAVAKEKVFDLFKAGVTDEEKVADLLARSEEALAMGDHNGAVQSLKQILVIRPDDPEAKSRLASLHVETAPAVAPAEGMEEPIADDVFTLQQLDETSVASDEEIDINWGEAEQIQSEAEKTADVADAVEEDVFAEAPAAEVDDIDVFGDVGETGAPSAKEEFRIPEPPAEPVVVAPEEKVEALLEEATEPVPAEEDLFPEEGAKEVDAALAAEAADLEAELFESKPAEEEFVEALDGLLSSTGVAEPVEKAEPAQREKVDLVEGIVYGTSDIFAEKKAAQEKAAKETLFTTAEISPDEFMTTSASQAKAAETPSRILEEFRPFTESTPDETLPLAEARAEAIAEVEGESVAAESAADRLAEAKAEPVREVFAETGDDLMAELINELEGGAMPAEPAVKSAAAPDLLDEIFGFAETGKAKEAPAGGDMLADLIDDLGTGEKEAAAADTNGDVFKSFVSSLPDDMRSSSSAQTHYELGIAFREMDQIEEAIAEFEKALTKDDGSLTFEVNYELGQCYSSLGKYDMAVEYLETARQSGGEDEQVQLDLTFELAVALKKQGNFKEAKALFVEVDKKSSNYRGAKAEIAECSKGRGKKGGDDNIGYV
ncbi:MAG: tetratricopeptide repeat protein [Myxococcales bacterium]|nr:tetratricopeptide repeat protein [Myxococcales bacterium]